VVVSNVVDATEASVVGKDQGWPGGDVGDEDWRELTPPSAWDWVQVTRSALCEQQLHPGTAPGIADAAGTSPR